MNEHKLVRLLGEALLHSYDGCEDDEVGLEGLEALEAYRQWKAQELEAARLPDGELVDVVIGPVEEASRPPDSCVCHPTHEPQP